MKQKTRVLAFLIGASATTPACSDLPSHYSAEAIEAWVVDAETKKPIEGVVVTANWQLIEGTFGGSVPVGQLMVLEAVSDKNGRFYFPPWGPKKAPKGHFASDDPQLLFFKSGYEYRRLSNSASTDRERALRPVRTPEWNGKTIELKPFKGMLEEYARHLAGDYRSEIRFLVESEEWKKTPCLLVALDVEVKRLGRRGFVALFTVPNLEREKRITQFVQRESSCEKR